MSKAWGGVGAWALDAERAEAEEREHAASEAAAILAGQPAQSFPSLKEAAATKPKKKKGVTVPLSQLLAPGGRSIEPRGLTPNEILRLPTGPKERSAEELEYGRLGGGFRSYGGGGGGGPRDGGYPSRRSDEGDGSWGGAGGGRRPYGGFDDEPRRGPPARVSDSDQPSRADEVDNWALGKKSFAPAPMDSGRHDRYSSLGSGSSSRADEVDNWAVGKKELPSRYPSFGSGFGDSPAPSDSDRWVRGGRGGGPLPHNGERPRLILDPPKGEIGGASEAVKTRPSPFGAARPREEVLKEKGLDWKKIDSEIELKKTSRPTSSHSNRPSSAQSSRPGTPDPQAGSAAEGGQKARPKVNPFGDAKPREVRLQEQGIDWKKLDLELDHRRVDRPETDEEKLLKEEINHLKSLIKEIEGNLNNNESAQFSAEEVTSLREQILHKETDLDLLIRQLDDKVRFGKRSTGDIRPGSGAGRVGMSSDRPSSRSGMSEDSRSMEFMERPRSRGSIGDAWAKPVDDRRGFQGGMERGYLGNRSMDRPKSRERW